MIVTNAMLDALYEIRRLEHEQAGRFLNVSKNELGNRLIALYYQTQKAQTRKLVTQFMTQAGAVWLRKLLAKDLSPIVSSRYKLASMDDYLSLLVGCDSGPELQERCA